MYDVSKLRTSEQCKTVMDRARERGLEDVYKLVFARYCELIGLENDDPGDPVVRDFYASLAAYEQLLFEKHGWNVKANRTRQKIQNKGLYQSLIEWTEGSTETNGFNALVELGLPEHTAEYIVAKHASRFPDGVVELARDRLKEHDVPLPEA